MLYLLYGDVHSGFYPVKAMSGESMITTQLRCACLSVWEGSFHAYFKSNPVHSTSFIKRNHYSYWLNALINRMCRYISSHLRSFLSFTSFSEIKYRKEYLNSPNHEESELMDWFVQKKREEAACYARIHCYQSFLDAGLVSSHCASSHTEYRYCVQALHARRWTRDPDPQVCLLPVVCSVWWTLPRGVSLLFRTRFLQEGAYSSDLCILENLNWLLAIQFISVWTVYAFHHRIIVACYSGLFPIQCNCSQKPILPHFVPSQSHCDLG